MQIINNPQCKNSHEVEGTMFRVEELIRKYENMTDITEQLPEGHKAAILIALCPTDPREHRDLSVNQFTANDVRDPIINYVERKTR